MEHSDRPPRIIANECFLMACEYPKQDSVLINKRQKV